MHDDRSALVPRGRRVDDNRRATVTLAVGLRLVDHHGRAGILGCRGDLVLVDDHRRVAQLAGVDLGGRLVELLDLGQDDGRRLLERVVAGPLTALHGLVGDGARPGRLAALEQTSGDEPQRLRQKVVGVHRAHHLLGLAQDLERRVDLVVVEQHVAEVGPRDGLAVAVAQLAKALDGLAVDGLRAVQLLAAIRRVALRERGHRRADDVLGDLEAPIGRVVLGDRLVELAAARQHVSERRVHTAERAVERRIVVLDALQPGQRLAGHLLGLAVHALPHPRHRELRPRHRPAAAVLLVVRDDGRGLLEVLGRAVVVALEARDLGLGHQGTRVVRRGEISRFAHLDRLLRRTLGGLGLADGKTGLGAAKQGAGDLLLDALVLRALGGGVAQQLHGHAVGVERLLVRVGSDGVARG